MNATVTNQLNIRSLKDLDAKRVAKLAELTSDDARVVTLHMPMERKGTGTRKNPIVFKNALSEALELLGARDGLRAKIDGLRELEGPLHPFWQEQKKGLILVVREEGESDAFLLPFPLDTAAMIGTVPSLSPLLRLTGGGRYHLLVLALGGLRLYKASRWDLEEVRLSHVPLTLDEAMKYDDPEESLQFRTVSASNMPGSGGGNIAFHGQGITGDEVRKKKIRRFFEMVDKGLPENFNDLEMPLALMGPDFEISLYSEVNHYPHLCGQHIVTNAARLSDDEVTQTVCEWVAGRDADERAQQIENLNHRLGPGDASIDFKEIVEGAETGRIATLFVDGSARRWGTSDSSRGEREQGVDTVGGAKSPCGKHERERHRDGEVRDPLREGAPLPHPASYYHTRGESNGLWWGPDLSLILADLDAIAPPETSEGVEGRILILHGTGDAGLAAGTTKAISSRLGEGMMGAIIHELGHSISSDIAHLGHPGGWLCPDAPVGPSLLDPTAGGCEAYIYGYEPFDPMGTGTRHFMAYHKWLMGMLDDSQIVTAETGQEYDLTALAVSGGGKMLRIPVDADYFYVVEYRKPVGLDGADLFPGSNNNKQPIDGVLVRMRMSGPSVFPILLAYPAGQTANPMVCNPGTPFEDPYRGIGIEVVSKAGDTARVRVTRDPNVRPGPLAITRPNPGQILLSWKSEPGATFLIERSSDLHTWTTVNQGYPFAPYPEGGSVGSQETLMEAADLPGAFYRVRRR